MEVKRRSLGLDKLPSKIKAVKGLVSIGQSPEPLEKGILRAKHGVSVFRDGTSRYDMSDVPVTHFKPIEIGTSWEALVGLGYTHDIRGNRLSSDTQMLELLPQDFIPSIRSKDHLLATCGFVDELLIRFYGMEPFYNASTEVDLVGRLAIGLALIPQEESCVELLVGLLLLRVCASIVPRGKEETAMGMRTA